MEGCAKQKDDKNGPVRSNVPTWANRRYTLEK